jgi:uncharacterized protein (TIGR03437 family)
MHAATTNTTLTVNGSGTVSATGVAFTGTANLGAPFGNGTFNATLSLTPSSNGNLSATFTIGLSGGNLTGTMSIPPAILTGGNVTASASITGGTGSYAGATGSFPSLTGSGGFSATGSITLSFTGAGSITTGGGGGGPTPPSITAVLDAGSYTANIAQGSIFVVKGTNMSASGYTAMSFPLPTTSGNVKITFTPAAGGAGTDAYLVYLYNQSGVNQLAGILPSTVATGNYNVTVTYNGTASAGFQVTVVQRKLGLITQDSSGTGLGVVQNYISASQLDVNRFTTGSVGGVTISPAKPGQVLIAWATGMGPVSSADNTASPGFDFSANGVNVQVLIGGTAIKPLYAGRAPGLAGADQINFQLPTNIITGCVVSMQISVNGNLSNPSFISIASDANTPACALAGFTAQQLQNFDQGGTYTTGGFSLLALQETVQQFGSLTFGTVSGAFTKYTGFQLASAAANSFSPTGACQVYQSTTTTSTIPTGNATNLDAGAISLNGPSGSNLTNVALKEDATNTYSATLTSIPGLGGGTNGTIVAGTYTLNGSGGKDIGKFNASVSIGAPLVVTGGLPTTVVRGSGLPLNWTGGNPTDIVEIFGSSQANTNSPTVSFICTTTAGQKTFTVPSSILNQLPASSANGGSLAVVSTINPTSGNGLFTAPVVAGGNIDAGFFLALSGQGGQATYQ